MKRVELSLSVQVPDTVTNEQIEAAINSALNEPPCDWQNWTVFAAFCTGEYPVEEDEG